MPHPWAHSAAGAIVAVAATVALAGCGSSPAAAVTTLTSASGVTVQAVDGSNVPGRAGLKLRRGDVVRTGADGSAILSTSGRTAYLGGDGVYTVTNGVLGVLQRGAFVVDARRGPQLRVQAGALSVRTDRSAIRVERTFAVRVGALAGNPVEVAAAESTLTLPRLYQLVVAGRALPRPTPLVLTGDDAERRVVPDLVFDDQQLTNTAAALDQGSEGRTIMAAGARAGLRITTAAFTTPRQPAVTPVPLSEAALPVAIARAAAGAGDAAKFRTRYALAVAARTAGGSWGVVAHLDGTDATATSAAIAALLGGTTPGGPALAPGPGTGGGIAGSPVTPSTPGTQPGGSGGNDGNGNGNGNGGGPSPGPSPTPSPTPPPDEVEPVRDLVETIIGILPPPAPRKSGAKSNDCKILGLLNC